MIELPPQIEGAAGIKWRRRKHGWECRWRARSDLVARGYLPKYARLWISTPEHRLPSPVECNWIADRCSVLQDEMLAWSRGGAPVVVTFKGTIESLIRCYQTDPDSTYQNLRYKTRLSYDALCARLTNDVVTDEHGIEAKIGQTTLAYITARKVLRWHKMWAAGGKTSMGHSLIGMLRTLLTFGATILNDQDCRAAKMMLHDMRFPMTQPRKERLTADQAVAIREMAHTIRRPSLALAQAIQFEGTLRQKDVIGEWIPLTETPLSYVTDGNMKWVAGVVWQEIDQNLVLTHVTSKRQKEIIIQLMLAPMVIDELKRQFPAAVRADGSIDRAALPASGPIIKNEMTSLPYADFEFRRQWRMLATACGIPATVYNMDTRAGAISEATDAGATLEDVRHAATHSNTSMTAKYSRGSEGKVASVMATRVAHRNKARTKPE